MTTVLCIGGKCDGLRYILSFCEPQDGLVFRIPIIKRQRSPAMFYADNTPCSPVYELADYRCVLFRFSQLMHFNDAGGVECDQLVVAIPADDVTATPFSVFQTLLEKYPQHKQGAE